MSNTTKRAAKEGFEFGLIAGVIFAIMEVLVAQMLSQPGITPFRMFASIVLGKAAMVTTMSPVTAFVVGGAVHVILSGYFGLVYGVVNAQLPPKTQTDWGRQVFYGVVYGIVLWLVNFQFFGRLVYPWFLSTSQFPQVVLHVLFYSLPLAMMYSGAERRLRRLTPVTSS